MAQGRHSSMSMQLIVLITSSMEQIAIKNVVEFVAFCNRQWNFKCWMVLLALIWSLT